MVAEPGDVETTGAETAALWPTGRNEAEIGDGTVSNPQQENVATVSEPGATPVV
jgi:hypothetical protein